MKDEFKDLIIIEKYFANQLDGKAKMDFEERMKKDSVFRQLVDDQTKLPEVLYSLEKERLANQAKSWNRAGGELNKDFKTRRISLKMVVGIAASLLILLLANVIFNNYQSSNSPQSLASTYLSDYYQAPVILRGPIQTESWSTAIDQYRNKNFTGVVEEMGSIIYENEANTEQLFYFGLAHLYKVPSEVDSTFVYFSKVLERDAEAYQEVIDWYKALIFLNNNEFKNARVLLETLRDSNQYSGSAKKLLKSIEQN